MKIITNIKEWCNERSSKNLGFVPTMGNLHSGHLSLIERSQQENNETMVSIYINPTQFNQVSDFTLYPRTLDADIELLKKAKLDYLLLPSYEDLYPDNFAYKVSADNEISQILEGEKRPGHFTGMLSVVLKLLQIAKPNKAYFGEKDFQQLTLIKGMAKAFFIDCEIISCPTKRENSRLPLSSRNNRLTEEEKKLADEFARILHSGDSIEEIRRQLEDKNIKIDYLSEYQDRIFAAVYIGNVRLIDNFKKIKEEVDAY